MMSWLERKQSQSLPEAGHLGYANGDESGEQERRGSDHSWARHTLLRDDSVKHLF